MKIEHSIRRWNTLFFVLGILLFLGVGAQNYSASEDQSKKPGFQSQEVLEAKIGHPEKDDRSPGASLEQVPSKTSPNLYLLFQIFTGGPHPETGIFHSPHTKAEYESTVKRIKKAIDPEYTSSNRKLGFSVGPLALDQSDADLKRIIDDSFQIALDNDMAVAFHLDDYMFWKNARDKNGKRLVDDGRNREWKDWQGTPSDSLKIGWLPNIPLAPQMCYESVQIKSAVTRAAREVIGAEIRKGVDSLVRSGREDLFAGVIVGWESNLADGYSALTTKGFRATNPPKDFDWEREKILHDHIERWAKGIYDAGISSEKIYTHVAIISRRHYDQWKRLPVEKFRQIPQSTAVRAFWAAFNQYSNPGFSVYPAEDLLEDIHNELAKRGNPGWALSEGTNVTPEETHAGLGARAVMSWETFLGKFFNHGARLVNVFGGWQGEKGVFGRTTESKEAVAAYRKFLRGERLVEREVSVESREAEDGTRNLPSRLQSLGGKVQRYRDRGGDMRLIERDLQLLGQYAEKQDLKNLERTLERIEAVIK